MGVSTALADRSSRLVFGEIVMLRVLDGESLGASTVRVPGLIT
jgi:hypothetical protein